MAKTRSSPGSAATPVRVILPVLMLAVFTISVGFGILQPQLPALIERLFGADSTPAQIAHATGLLLGKQTSAASLGAAVGSAAGGVLYDVTWLPNAAFVLAAGVALLTVWPSLRLPGRLMPGAAMKLEIDS